MLCIVCSFALLGIASTAWAGTGTMDASTKTADISVYFVKPMTPAELTMWKGLFQDMSNRLYTATDQKLRLKKVDVYIRATDKKDDVDVVIGDIGRTANAQLSGIGAKGTRIFFDDWLRTNDSFGRPAGLTLTHEWGHYAFGLGDEYCGQWVPFAKKDSWTKNDLSGLGNYGSNLRADAFIRCKPVMIPKDPQENFSMMSGPRNVALGFCNDASHNFGMRDGTKWWLSDQQYNHKKSCWATMLGLKDSKGVSLFTAAPAAYPASPLTAPDIEWNVYEGLARMMLCIDRSGSMDYGYETPSKMTYAKWAANVLCQLAEGDRDITDADGNPQKQPSDWVGVVDYDDTITITHSLVKMGDDPAQANTTRAGLISAINTLSARGSTSIGGGLASSLAEIQRVDTLTGQKGSGRVIVLLSDGQQNSGTSPGAVIPGLQAAKVKVYSIGIGGDVDAATMGNIAAETGGKYRFVGDAVGLFGVMLDFRAEFKGGLVKNTALSAPGGSVIGLPIAVDSLSERAEFVLACENTSGLKFTIKSPKGKIFDESSPADGVAFSEGNGTIMFRVDEPGAGNWTLSVENTGTAGKETYVSANVDNQELNTAVSTDSPNYVWPQHVIITCSVTAGSGVAGVDVSADITEPNGVKVTVPLYDDGSLECGDAQAEDGIYTAVFTPRKNGAHNMRVVINNKTGYLAANKAELPVSKIPVPPFQRETTLSFNVTGAPVIYEQYLRVDNMNLTLNPKKFAADTMILSGEFNGLIEPYKNGMSITYNYWTSDWFDAGKFIIGRGSKVTYKDPAKLKTVSMLMNQGGSSRTKFALTSKSSFADLRGSTQIAINATSDTFNDSLTICPLKKGKDGSTGSTYQISRDFYISSELFIDSLILVHNKKKDGLDALRIAGRTPGNQFDPGTQPFKLDLGWISFEVPAGSWVKSAKDTIFTYTSPTLVGSKYKYVLKINKLKRTFSFSGTGMTVSSGILSTSAQIGMTCGAFSKDNAIVLGRKTTATTETYSY
jgi:hypothetical protein